jgi:predicted DNA-binding ribbon-helix-helix protein
MFFSKSKEASMTVGRLVTGNFGGGGGRICMKLEPELWGMLAEICDRETVAMTTLLREIERAGDRDNHTRAVRVYIATYFHAAATGSAMPHAVTAKSGKLRQTT